MPAVLTVKSLSLSPRASAARGRSPEMVLRRGSTAFGGRRARRTALAKLIPELSELTRAAELMPVSSVRQLIMLLEKITDALRARAAPAAEAAPPDGGPPLGPQSIRVLELLKSGRSEKEIGNVLGISVNTVHHYVKAIYRRYDVHSRNELLALWVGPRQRSRLEVSRAAADDGK
jgi:DNA-binding NarL/FixJ family response regulator